MRNGQTASAATATATVTIAATRRRLGLLAVSCAGALRLPVYLGPVVAVAVLGRCAPVDSITRGRRRGGRVIVIGGGAGGVGDVEPAAEGGVLANVVEDAAQESGEGGYLAGAEEGEGVGLDSRGPVCRVGVEGVEELVLDPVRERRGERKGW